MMKTVLLMMMTTLLMLGDALALLLLLLLSSLPDVWQGMAYGHDGIPHALLSFGRTTSIRPYRRY